MSNKHVENIKNTQIPWLCAHTALILHCQNLNINYKHQSIMDMFLLAVRFLGAMAELKEMTHKVLG